MSTNSSLKKEVLMDRIKATIYGNCIGDAIGLLTEFMTKKEAIDIYGRLHSVKSKAEVKSETIASGSRLGNLEYSMKRRDWHRRKYDFGDWTDDSDQMMLILLSLIDNNGEMIPQDFGQRLKTWSREGFRELGDSGKPGIGRTTRNVIQHRKFNADPHWAARSIWESSGRQLAANGGVMRTSVLGIQDFGDIDKVIANSTAACLVTHADPRCIASCVAVTTAIALMLQGKHVKDCGSFDIEAIIRDAYDYSSNTLDTKAEKDELKNYMYADSLEKLKLDEDGKIGYTYKCMGAGFWALRQHDFRASIEAITYEGGDADTNGAVAGALLGCKLGTSALPPSWLNELKHKDWLDYHINRYLTMLGLNVRG